MSSAKRMTYSMISQRFDELDQREGRLRTHFRAPQDPNLSLAERQPSLAASFDDETTASMEKLPMQALTNFGMGYLATWKDTAGKPPITDANGMPTRHRFADVLEYQSESQRLEEEAARAQAEAGSDDEDFPQMEPGALSRSIERQSRSRSSLLNESLGSSVRYSPHTQASGPNPSPDVCLGGARLGAGTHHHCWAGADPLRWVPAVGGGADDDDDGGVPTDVGLGL
eukprot:COSAG01_NODE_20523_length_949_cov_1.428235_1_plen_226_part_10